jgi:dihydrofolate synthase / folylpolyglutamate synthase
VLTYSESLRLLLSLERLGMKFGLEGITGLLRALDDPHKTFPSIHVAGTNGKGSVASMLAAVFTAAGYKTGLYTSPHLVRFEERIRIDGRPISRKAVAAIVTKLRPLIGKQRPTFFETTTAVAFKHFAEKEVDIAIVETGLGGRLDSTNVLRPLISIITTVGLEHTEILGGTIEEIAREKAGIVKKNTPCITGIRSIKALKVLRSVCAEQHAPLTTASDYRLKIRKSSLGGSMLDIDLGGVMMKRLFVSLPGHLQFDNLALVLQTVSKVRSMGEFALNEDAVRKGLAHVQELSGLTGRLTTVQQNPLVLVDVAHNADAMAHLVDTLRRLGKRKITLVFGVMKDKDCSAMVRSLVPITERAIAVAARSERSRSASDVAAAFAEEGCRVQAALSVQEGIRIALEIAPKKGLILVTGSHFVVGEAMPVLTGKKS